MATPSSLLTEENFLCSICLDVLTQPVSIPCGHNFCMACIRKHWDSNYLCQCPMCKKTFDKRPELFINTFISEMATQFKESAQVKHPAKPGEVPCDICTGAKLKALKSCLVCLTSFCETHLEPHHRALALKKHKLIGPAENLEDRICKKHGTILELFCRTDQTCVCRFCAETDHKTHSTVPVEEECEERKTQLEETDGELQEMILERLEKVGEIKLSVETSKRNAEKDLSDSVEICTALVSCIERSQDELIELIEEKQKSAEKQAEGFIKELEQEITDLEMRSSKLEQLSHSEDHIHFLQSFSPPPPTKDWSEIRVETAVSHLDKRLRKEMENLVKLKMMQQYAVNVTLDPDTAHPNLTLSVDGKQVSHGATQKKKNKKKRFTDFFNVLGKQGFSTGSSYYEVQVEGKTRWLLGVARESINRKGRTTWSPMEGVWVIHRKNLSEYLAHADPDVTLVLSEEPQKVGVFVEYEEGRVSFYNVEARSHIYSFTNCTFTEKLYPFFNPWYLCRNNTAPLIITPVNL